MVMDVGLQSPLGLAAGKESGASEGNGAFRMSGNDSDREVTAPRKEEHIRVEKGLANIYGRVVGAARRGKEGRWWCQR